VQKGRAVVGSEASAVGANSRASAMWSRGPPRDALEQQARRLRVSGGDPGAAYGGRRPGRSRHQARKRGVEPAYDESAADRERIGCGRGAWCSRRREDAGRRPVRGGGLREPEAEDPLARERPVPNCERHQALCGHGGLAARGRASLASGRLRRAMVARPGAEREVDHASRAAQPHERALRLRQRPCLDHPTDRQSRSGMVTPRAGRNRDRAPAIVSARYKLVVLEHQLRPARARRRGGHAQDPR
jgi:hypothetical protein